VGKNYILPGETGKTKIEVAKMLRLSSARLAPPFGVQNIYFWKSILP
jgi:hypothetical protein